GGSCQDHRNHRHRPVLRCRQLLREPGSAARAYASLRGRLGSPLLYRLRAAPARPGSSASQAQRRLAGPSLYQPRSGLLMYRAVRMLRWFGAALGLLIVILLAALGLMQTQAGRTWFAGTAAQAINDPDFTVAIEGLRGLVPFRLKVD